MELNETLHVMELSMPKGVEPVIKLKHENPSVVSVHVPKEIVIEEEAPAPVTEIIGEVPAEGEEAAAAAEGGEKGEKKEAAAGEKKEPAAAQKKEPAAARRRNPRPRRKSPARRARNKRRLRNGPPFRMDWRAFHSVMSAEHGTDQFSLRSTHHPSPH